MERHNLRIKWTTPVAQTAESCWPWQHERSRCLRRSIIFMSSGQLGIYPFRIVWEGCCNFTFQSIRLWSKGFGVGGWSACAAASTICRLLPWPTSRHTRSLAHRTSRTAARRKGESDVGDADWSYGTGFRSWHHKGVKKDAVATTAATPRGQTRAPLWQHVSEDEVGKQCTFVRSNVRTPPEWKKKKGYKFMTGCFELFWIRNILSPYWNNSR